MRNLRSRYSLKKKDADTLVLSTSPMHMLTYLSIFLIFLIVFLLNFDPEEHLQGKELIPTLLFILLMALILAVSMITRAFTFNRKTGAVSVTIGLLYFIILFETNRFPMDEIEGVLLRQINLTGHNQKRSSGFNRWYQDKLAIKTVLYKLILERRENPILIDQSTSRQDLEAEGKAIASMTSVPFQTQII